MENIFMNLNHQSQNIKNYDVSKIPKRKNNRLYEQQTQGWRNNPRNRFYCLSFQW